MDKRLALVMLATAVLTSPSLLDLSNREAAASSWGPWVCGWAISGYPVSGGTMSGRGCAQWWTGSEPWWGVWGDTYVPYSHTIRTYVQGDDRCGGGSWAAQMSKTEEVYNTDYGTSGDTGSYLTTCTTGHYYRTYNSSSRKRYSWSSWESSNGYVYH